MLGILTFACHCGKPGFLSLSSGQRVAYSWKHLEAPATAGRVCMGPVSKAERVADPPPVLLRTCKWIIGPQAI
eukprot:4461943-Amphidinium_carterae.1